MIYYLIIFIIWLFLLFDYDLIIFIIFHHII